MRRPPATPRPSLANFWHDVRARAWLYQAMVVAGVIALGAFLIGNAQEALARQGITTGFAFLTHQAGFEIGERLIAFDSTDTFLRAYGVALLNTLKVAAASIVLATVIGVLVGLGRLSSNVLARKLASAYVELFRNTPQLVLLIFCYTLLTRLPAPRAAISVGGVAFLSNRGLSVPWVSGDGADWLPWAALVLGAILLWAALRWARRRRPAGAARLLSFCVAGAAAALPVVALKAFGPEYHVTVPELRGFNFAGGAVLSPEFLALLMGLSLYIGAFIAEIVRSGILSVGRGQVEAAKAIGLGSFDIYRKVIFPQALRGMVPPAAVQYVSIVKNSSLGVAIGYPELFSVNNTIGTLSGQVVEAIAIMMAIYLGISFVIAALMNAYNRIVQIKER
jgi:general L-amino acid transport system permease protein